MSLSPSSTSASTSNSPRWWQLEAFNYSALECFVMRLAFAVLLFVSIKWETAPYHEQRNPTGLAHLFDLTWLAAHPPGLWVQIPIALCLVLYVLGLRPALGLAPVTIAAVLIGTLVTSTAMHHSWQLLTLIALAQLIVYAWPREQRWHRLGLGLFIAALVGLTVFEAFHITVVKTGFAGVMSWLGHAIKMLARNALLGWMGLFGLKALFQFKTNTPAAVDAQGRAGLPLHDLAVRASTVVFAASYVVCGIVKLVNSDFKWVQKVPNLAVQLLKSNWSSYYDTVPAAIVPGHLMPPTSPEWMNQAVQAIVDYPNFARLFFGGGLLIELIAFVVLINRRWAFWGGLAVIGLHLSISAVMQLHFTYHMLATLIFFINLPGLLTRGLSSSKA